MSEHAPNYTGRRIAAAAVAGGLLVTGGLAAKEVKQSYDANQAEQATTEYFSQPGIGEKILSMSDEAQKDSLPEKVLIYSVRDGDRIYNIASRFGAEDHSKLVRELSQQVGGAGNLQHGDKLAIPASQVSPENWIAYPVDEANTGRSEQGIEPIADDLVVYAVPTETRN